MAAVLMRRVASSLSIVADGANPSLSLSFPNLSPIRKYAAGLSSQYALVGGVAIPNDKKLELALQRIHGIGRSKSHKIRVDLNMENKPTRDLTGFELNKLNEEVSKYMIEWELQRLNRSAIERLEKIDCYRGIRHQSGLPCRGQRTHTNSRTVKRKKTGAK